MTYSIPECNFENLTKKISAIRKKCEKYGCDFRFEVVGSEYKRHTFEDGSIGLIKYISVDVEGCAKLADWEVVAILDHKHSAGNVVHVLDSSFRLPDEYYYSKGKCDHCNTSRYRRYTAIVRNVKTGNIKQIGGSCLKSYTQGFDAEFITKYLQCLKDIDDCCSWEISNSSTRYFDRDRFLICVAECTLKFGFYPTSSEYSTKQRALDILNYLDYQIVPDWAKSADVFLAPYEAVGFNLDSTELIKLSDDTKDWIKRNEASNQDYMHNLNVVFADPYISYKDLGIAASAVYSYLKDHKEITNRRNVNTINVSSSQHVGCVKDKITVDVASCSVAGVYSTIYGTTSIYRFVDIDGNVYVWHTSTYIEHLNRVKSVSGTIKSHSEFKGEKQTVLTRCKIQYCIESDIIDSSAASDNIDEALSLLYI